MLIVILSIIGTISVLTNIGLIKLLKETTNALMRLQYLTGALAWTEGRDINEKLIKRVFKNVRLILNFIEGEDGQVMYDLSNYEKKNIIGLTYYFSDGIERRNCIVPNASVCELKNGIWLWRPEAGFRL